MATVYDKDNRWTIEADQFSRVIRRTIINLLKEGTQAGFSDTDIFYMIATETYDRQNSKRVLGTYE